MTRIATLFAGMVLTGFMLVPLHGNTVVHFDMSELSGVTEDPWFEGTHDENIEIAQELTRNGLESLARGGEFASSGWNATDDFEPDDRFLSFAVSPLEGHTLWVKEVRFEQTASISGPGTMRIRASKDSFEANLINEDDLLGSVSGTTASGTFALGTFIQSDEVMEVRIYAYGSLTARGAASSEEGAIRISNLVIEGAVISDTHEPASIALHRAVELSFESEDGRAYKIQKLGVDDSWIDLSPVAGSGDLIRRFLSFQEHPTESFRIVTD